MALVEEVEGTVFYVWAPGALCVVVAMGWPIGSRSHVASHSNIVPSNTNIAVNNLSIIVTS